MVSKQNPNGQPKQTQLPIRHTHIDLKKNQEAGGKRSFSPSLPTLLQRAAHSPQSITPTESVHLQQTIGNQAVGRMMRVQAKLTLGPVGDKYEQEADVVAKQVVQNLNVPKPQAVQRQEDEEELQMQPLPTISTLQRQEDEEELQAKPFTPIHPTLPLLQRQEDEEELQMMPNSNLQKQEEEEEMQMKPSSTMGGGEISADIENSIQNKKGNGQPLAKHIRTPMEQSFGADFSGVKIHTDSQSDQLNQSIQARAFTTGQDIFFRQGEYNPGNSAGQELVAHELTHVVQQNGGQVHRPAANAPHIQRLWNPFKKKKKPTTPTRAFMLNPEDSTEFIPKKGESVYLCDYPPGTPVEVASPAQYDKADKNDDIEVYMTIEGKRVKGKINGKKYIMERIEEAQEEAKPKVEEIGSTTEGSTKDSYELTVAVARKSPYYFDYQKKRLKLRIKNTVKKRLGWVGWPFRKKPKSLGKDEMKTRAARTAVRSRLKSQQKKDETIDESEVNTEVDKLINDGNAMGHTWIKLKEQQGNTRKKWSFGFWPRDGINNPREVVPGKVKSPDEYHESRPDEEQLDLTYPVNAKQYGKALAKAQEHREEPPTYKMTGYNCTQFAREISSIANVSFPSQGAIMPFVGRVHNPNLVYEAIEKIKKKTVKDDLSEEEVSKKPHVTFDSNHPELYQEPEAEPELEPEPEPVGPVVTFAPDKPIQFFRDQGGNSELPNIENPTQIEILDPDYPDIMEGWENVNVKNLETKQIGYINFTDLDAYSEL